MKSEEDLHDITKNGITTSSADDLQSKPVDGIKYYGFFFETILVNNSF